LELNLIEIYSRQVTKKYFLRGDPSLQNKTSHTKTGEEGKDLTPSQVSLKTLTVHMDSKILSIMEIGSENTRPIISPGFLKGQRSSILSVEESCRTHECRESMSLFKFNDFSSISHEQ
jgi:hypothetical protein